MWEPVSSRKGIIMHTAAQIFGCWHCDRLSSQHLMRISSPRALDFTNEGINAQGKRHTEMVTRNQRVVNHYQIYCAALNSFLPGGGGEPKNTFVLTSVRYLTESYVYASEPDGELRLRESIYYNYTGRSLRVSSSTQLAHRVISGGVKSHKNLNFLLGLWMYTRSKHTYCAPTMCQALTKVFGKHWAANVKYLPLKGFIIQMREIINSHDKQMNYIAW